MHSFAACLLLGLWCSLAPAAAGKKLLARASPVLLLLLSLWQLASYAATVLAHAIHLPNVYKSIGIAIYAAPPPLCLVFSGQLLLVLSAAGLVQHQTRRR